MCQSTNPETMGTATDTKQQVCQKGVLRPILRAKHNHHARRQLCVEWCYLKQGA